MCQTILITPFNSSGLPCSATFATDGWSYIEFPTKNYCCKCTNYFGAVRYDWLDDNATYVGTDTIDGYSVTHWTKEFKEVNHYYSTVDKQLPVQYFEIYKGNEKH